MSEFNAADPVAAKRVQEMAERYESLFEINQTGQVVLDDLMRRFSLHSGASLHGGIDAVLQTYFKEGQRSVINHIVLQINRAKGLPE